MAKKPEVASDLVDKPVENVENPHSLNGSLINKLEFGLGCHLLGQTLTLDTSRGYTMKVVDHGVVATSKSGRVMFLPWTNIKAAELKAANPKAKVGQK